MQTVTLAPFLHLGIDVGQRKSRYLFVTIRMPIEHAPMLSLCIDWVASREQIEKRPLACRCVK